MHSDVCVQKMGVIHPISHSNIHRQFLGTVNMAVIAILAVHLPIIIHIQITDDAVLA